MNDGLNTSGLFELAPDGDGCQLTLTHSGLSARNGRGAGVRAGWHAILEGLADSLDGRTTPWSVKEQRETAAAPLYAPLTTLLPNRYFTPRRIRVRMLESS